MPGSAAAPAHRTARPLSVAPRASTRTATPTPIAESGCVATSPPRAKTRDGEEARFAPSFAPGALLTPSATTSATAAAPCGRDSAVW